MTVLRDYAASVGQPTLGGTPRYDEVVDAEGGLRPAWRSLAHAAVDLTPDDLGRVHGEIASFLADDAVTYNRPGRGPEPWRLDPVPLVLDAATWAPLEVGLAQRAELLNALLADIYGPQEVLRRGVIPAPVVLAHAGFTRVVARPSAIDPRRLVLAGTDLGRDASGEWRVLADRIQAPSGLGYAMENRRVLSRVLPELYQEAAVHRLTPYLAALRSALLQSAQGDMADPRVVVLSPGTHSETAYDQAFLASSLGFPLLQGSDLVVRDGWVWMKPPGWPQSGRLQRVDVILRRVDAPWCDPLELRADSQLGVAGLVEAVRRGRVRLVNGLGAGVMENPGLLPYLPAACEALLGEELRLRSPDTWWCGDPDGLAHVLAHLGSLTVRSLDGSVTGLARLSPEKLRARIQQAPHRFVGQQRLPLSQAPAWQAAPDDPRSARSRPITLRTITLRYGSAYRPLMGGMADVLDEEHRTVSTKDVWVLKADPTDTDQGLTDVLPMTATRASTVLVPRALEDMFWFGRYAERAEDLIRLVLAAHTSTELLTTRPTSAGASGVRILMDALGVLAGRRYSDLDDEFRSLLLDTDRSGSAAQSLLALRDALEGVRDQVSGDTWRVFGTAERAQTALRESRASHQVADSAGRMLTGILSLQGVSASMIRDPGWHLLEAGRAIERGLQLCTLLGTATVRRGIDVDREVLNGVLAAAESQVTHRRRYRGYVRPRGVLELLLTDPDNPRSLRFCIASLPEHLGALPASTGSTRPERMVEELARTLAEVDVAALVAIGGTSRPYLERFLAETSTQLDQIAASIADVHFASGPAPQPLTALALTELQAGAPR